MLAKFIISTGRTIFSCHGCVFFPDKIWLSISWFWFCDFFCQRFVSLFLIFVSSFIIYCFILPWLCIYIWQNMVEHSLISLVNISFFLIFVFSFMIYCFILWHIWKEICIRLCRRCISIELFWKLENFCSNFVCFLSSWLQTPACL